MTVPDKIAVSPNKFFQISSIVLYAFFIWAFASNIESHWENDDTLWLVFYNISIALFTYFFIRELRILILNKPYFSMDTEGVHTPKYGLIPWADIRKIQFQDTLSRKASCYVYVKNPETYINKFTGFQYHLIDQLHKEKGTPIWLTFPLASIKKGELEAVIDKYLHDFS
jgi:hypothetical protein